MKNSWFVFLTLLMCVPTVGFGQQGAPLQAPIPEPVEIEILEEFPKEVVHEGTRLYDFEFDPKPESVIDAGTRIVVKFKYETDAPGKIFVGAMPIIKGNALGGYQPVTLNENEGAGEVGMICGGYGGAPSIGAITTPEELKATYLHVDQLEILVYGGVKKEGKFRAPLSFTVIPNAAFTVKDKYYLDRLVKELVALRKRVDELEAQAKQ